MPPGSPARQKSLTYLTESLRRRTLPVPTTPLTLVDVTILEEAARELAVTIATAAGDGENILVGPLAEIVFARGAAPPLVVTARNLGGARKLKGLAFVMVLGGVVKVVASLVEHRTLAPEKMRSGS